MAYNPTTWQTGDTITATAMNKIENGIANAGGVFIAEITSPQNVGDIASGDTLDKTFAEINDALASGIPAYVKRTHDSSEPYAFSSAMYPILGIFKYDTQYRVYVSCTCQIYFGGTYTLSKPTTVIFTANSTTDYPTASYCITVNDSATTDEWQ